MVVLKIDGAPRPEELSTLPGIARQRAERPARMARVGSRTCDRHAKDTLAERSKAVLKAPFRKGVGSNPTGVTFVPSAGFFVGFQEVAFSAGTSEDALPETTG